MKRYLSTGMIALGLSLCSASLPGNEPVQTTSDHLWPKELDSAMQMYESKELQNQVVSYLNIPKDSLPKARLEAARFLFDLRSDDITVWLLTKSPVVATAVTDLQDRKHFLLRDALPIGKAMLGTARTELTADGTEAELVVAHLAEAFRRCLRLDRDTVPLEGESKAQMKKWAFLAIERAMRDAVKDKKINAELQRLKAELSGL